MNKPTLILLKRVKKNHKLIVGKGYKPQTILNNLEDLKKVNIKFM